MIDKYSALSKRYLKHNKKKSVLTMIGIILSVALICTIGTFIVTMQNTQLQQEIATNGDYHVEIYNITSDLVEKIANNPRVEYAAKVKPEPPVPFVKDKKIIVFSGDKNGPQSQSAKVKEGKLPEKDDEIAMEEWVLKYFDNKPKIGESIEIRNVNGEAKKYTLTAIVENNRDSQYSGIARAYTYADIKDTKDATVFVKIKGNTGKRKVIDDIKNIAGKDNVKENDGVLRASGESSNSNTNNALWGIAAVVIGIVVVATVVVIYNSFNISVAERSKHFGQLRAMGATKKQIKKLVLIEALIMMIISIPVGLALGLLAMYIVSIVFKLMATGFELDIIISPIVLLVSAGLGIISVYGSALLPAIKVSKISPLVAISSSYLISKENIRKNKRKSKIIKSLGIDKIMAIKNIKRNKKRFYITAISMAISVILFVTFMSFIKFAMNFSEKPKAQDDANFFITENIEVLEHKGLSDELIKDINNVSDVNEVYLNYKPLKLKTVVDENKIPKIIKDQNYKFINDVKLGGQNKKYLSINMNAFDDNKIKSLEKYIESGNIQAIKENEVIIVKNEQMPNKIYSQIIDLKVGDEIKIDPNYFYTKEELTRKDYMEGKTPKVEENPKAEYTSKDLITLRVKAIIKDKPYNGMGDSGIQKVIIKTDNLKKIIKNNDVYMKNFRIDTADLKVNDNEKIDSVDKSLTKLLEKYPDYQIYNMVEMNRQAKGGMYQMMILLIGFVVVIALISSINVINTVTTNIITRKRELSGLKAIGMTSKELKKMISLEGALFGGYGGVIGSIIGTVLSYLMYKRFSDIRNFSFEVPYRDIIIAMVGVIMIGYVSSLIAMRKLSKDNIIEGIKQE